MSDIHSVRAAPAKIGPAAQIVPPADKSEDIGADRRAAIRVWRGSSIDGQVHSRTLDKAYRLWLFHRVSRQPRLRDLVVETTMHDQTLLNLKLGDEYLTVAQSENHIAQLGHDLRGSLSSERKFATANSLRELFDECLAKNQPLYARYISSLSDRSAYWETMILPLSADTHSKPIFTLSYMSALNEKIDILSILYDRSPVGIVAAVPIMDGQEKTDDARILTMNVKAREILALPENKPQLHTVGELIRHIGMGLHWTPIGNSTQDHATVITYQATTGERFSLTIELLSGFILISVAPAAVERTQAWNRFARLVGLS